MEAWLELDRLRGTWTSEAPASYTRTELEDALGIKDVHTLNRLVEADVLQIEGGAGARRQGEFYRWHGYSVAQGGVYLLGQRLHQAHQ